MIQFIKAAFKRLRRWPLFYDWLPLIVWMGIIFWLSSQPEPFNVPESWQGALIGMAGHAIGYAGLGWLWWRTLSLRWDGSARKRLVLAFLLTVLYAVSDELHQRFVPGRSADPLDLLIDASAAGLSLGLLYRRQMGKTDDESV